MHKSGHADSWLIPCINLWTCGWQKVISNTIYGKLRLTLYLTRLPATWKPYIVFSKHIIHKSTIECIGITISILSCTNRMLITIPCTPYVLCWLYFPFSSAFFGWIHLYFVPIWKTCNPPYPLLPHTNLTYNILSSIFLTKTPLVSLAFLFFFLQQPRFISSPILGLCCYNYFNQQKRREY